MKKFIICATAAIVATLSLATTADAQRKWRHHDNHRNWNHEYRHSDNNWRRHHNRGWRNNGWRGNYGIIIAPSYAYADYCFVKKVKRYDEWGNRYYKRIRVCR